MSKIGVITINDFNNYGNRLQCYAAQCFLNDMGYDAENIYNDIRGNFVIEFGKRAVRAFRNFGCRKIIAARKRNFDEFNKNIKFSDDVIINGRYDKSINGKYDFFVTGSDQVWNPYDSGRSGIDFLSFASDEKKVSFSASIGTETLPDSAKDRYKEYLKNFKSISVRENSAKKIVEDLTGRGDVRVLPDPTLLISVEKWDSVSQKPDYNYGPKYILSYFLGGCGKYESVIKGIAEKYSCEIIDIYDRKSEFYSCGPQHFLNLEKNAFLICTDSFHSAVFAFIFNRPFIVFNRDNTKINMNARMETLLQEFSLEKCKYDKEREISEYLTWDYSRGYEVLKKKREEARDFIIQALSPIELY